MKDHIRKDMLAKRNALSDSEVFRKSEIIKQKLFVLDECIKAQTILFYVSYGNEVHTHDMVKECLNSEKQVVVPISNKQDATLFLSKLTSWGDLEPGSYSILEPKKDSIKEASLESIDLVIVPGVAFDTKGHRIGHGRGYYDNLLNKPTKALKVGLAYDFQIVDQIPYECHDVPVNRIITENHIINCIF